jgi:hypothetical protein
MTNQHPITPPPELVEQWWDAVPGTFAHLVDEMQLATAAAQWGADQQLEACCEQLKSIPSPIGIPFGEMASNALRNACRPEPPSLKEQALALLDKAEDPSWDINDFSIIRKALEAL